MSRSRALRSAALGTLAARLAAVACVFLTTPFLVDGLGSVRYGVYATITMIASLLSFSDLGVGSSLVTRLAEALARDDARRQRQLVASAVAILTAAALVLAAALSVLVFLVPVDRLVGAAAGEADTVRTSVLVYGLLFAAAIPMVLGQRILTAQQRGGQAAGWLAAITVLSSVGGAASARAGAGLVVVVGVTALIPVLVGFGQTAYLLLREHRSLLPSRTDLDRAVTRELGRSAGAFVVLQLAIAIGFQTDIFVVSAILGSDDAGRYAVTLRLYTLVSMVAGLLCAQFWPATAEALSRGDRPWVRRMWLRLTALTGAVALVGCGGLTLVGRPFVRWWVGADLVPPLSLLVVMGLWTAWVAFLQPTAMLLNGAGVLRIQVWTAVAMAVINLPLSLLLADRMGVVGPPLASLIASLATTAVPSWLAARRQFV